MWESHTDTEARRFVKADPDRVLPTYTGDEPGCGAADRMVVSATVTLAALSPLETLLRRLLPTPVVPPSPPKAVPTELERLLWQLMGEVRELKPAPLAKSGLPTTVNRHFGRGTTCLASGVFDPDPAGTTGSHTRNWATIVCFSCGKAGHGVGWCPKLNETFPFMLPGLAAEKLGDSYVVISPQVAAELRWADNGN